MFEELRKFWIFNTNFNKFIRIFYASSIFNEAIKYCTTLYTRTELYSIYNIKFGGA